jgi:shikimate kinase/3-dehydroquinate synthase
VTLYAPPALDRHIALVGFMGAGKTTIGREVARLTERPFIDLDDEIEKRHGPIARIFEEQGEAEFRRIEETIADAFLRGSTPAVLALGGGAVLSEATRTLLRGRAFSVWIEVAADVAWERVTDSDRPLVRNEATFRKLHEEREAFYRRASRDVARDADEVLLAALHVMVAPGRLSAPLDVGAGSGAVVADKRVLELHRNHIHAANVLPVAGGEAAKTIAGAEELWARLEVGRDDLLVALGGGSVTDLVGFVAATYLRGLGWVAAPSTLVGQVDAAIGGKTGIDLPKGKNLVGAFHFPRSVLLDPTLLSTLPERERRNGMAEVVKTGLLAGRPLWELPEEDMIRAAAAFKCAVVISDPYEQGRRAILNLGHTFGHALEAASDYALPHGEAVALGLLAALRLSGQPTDVVEELLAPQPVPVDRDRAWAAFGRDKKAREGSSRLVLLRAPGEPAYGVELPEKEVRAALDSLIAD